MCNTKRPKPPPNSKWYYLVYYLVYGPSQRRHISYEPICGSLRQSVIKKQPGKTHVSKNCCFWIFWPHSAISGARIWPKLSIAHLQAKTFHMNQFPGLYDHPLQRYSLEKIMFKKPLFLDISAKLGHFRWPILAKPVKMHIYRPRPFM